MPLYPYQETVFNHLMDGKNIIIQAPTGAGKTRAALYPFLTALDPAAATTFGKLPLRCIYSVPMRVLAKQFIEEYRKTTHIYNLKYGLRIIAAIQTGEQPNDPELTANLIFATIDQTLSSYLLAPYSLGKRKANINAGAVLSSYLVFDEFHLYDPESTLPTTLQMLKTLKGITPFVLMTATFSQTMLAELANLLDAVVVPSSAEEQNALAQISSQAKKRFYRIANQPLSARAVLATHAKRSLVICNTVDRARRLYDQLIAITPADTKVLLLHSRFLAQERNQIENMIREAFGKGNTSGSYIAVATQAIEVGVDMTSTTLHTELAPANAIIQRAGRCARYEGDIGTVYIYPFTFNPDNPNEQIDLTDPNNTAPYVSQAELFPMTLTAFQAREGEFRFADEQAIITEVHNAQDKAVIAQIRESSHNYLSSIFAVQRGEEDARHLIREIQQQNVIIHPDPDVLLRLEYISPLMLPAFGLHPGTLQGYIRRWLIQGDALNLEWSVKFLYDFGSEKNQASESRAQTNEERYQWIRVNNPDEAKFAPLVVVHPLLATYDEKRGLVADEGGPWQTPIPEPKNIHTERPKPKYRLETYVDHIRHVYSAFLDRWWEAEWAARKLEERFHWQPGSVRCAAELAVLLHDVGKLSIEWQKWVRDYQAKIGMPVQTGEAYAHTELQNDVQREIERQMRKRPWHAVEGAIAVLPVLAAALQDDDLLRGAFSAIARHHTPYSSEHQPYRLIKNARQHIMAAFGNVMPAPDLSELVVEAAYEDPYDFIPNPDGNTAAFLVYLLIARALRRADVAGTIIGSHGVKAL